MVEPITLGVIAAALAAKAVERAEDGVVDAGAQALSDLLEKLSRFFRGPKGEEGSSVLERLREAPDSPKRQHDLAKVIDHVVLDSPEFREDLEASIREAQKVGVEIGSITQSASGTRNVQIAGATNSEIAIASVEKLDPSSDR